MGLDYGRKNLAFTNMTDARKFIETYRHLFIVPKRKNKKEIEEGSATVFQTNNKQYPYEVGFLMNHDTWREMCNSGLITRKTLYCGYIDWADHVCNKSILCFKDGGDINALLTTTPEEFENEMNDVFTDVYPDTIVEGVHSVCGLLKELGYEEGASVFSACVNDWFDTYIFDKEGSLNDLCDAGRV